MSEPSRVCRRLRAVSSESTPEHRGAMISTLAQLPGETQDRPFSTSSAAATDRYLTRIRSDPLGGKSTMQAREGRHLDRTGVDHARCPVSPAGRFVRCRPEMNGRGGTPGAHRHAVLARTHRQPSQRLPRECDWATIPVLKLIRGEMKSDDCPLISRLSRPDRVSDQVRSVT